MKTSYELLKERFKWREVEIKDALNEVESLLDGNSDWLEMFYTGFVNNHWGSNLEKLTKEQAVVRKAKKINNKITSKSHELYELLSELSELSSESDDIDFPDFFPLKIINDAVKNNSNLDSVDIRVARQNGLYKRILGSTVKRILNKEEPHEYCPPFRYLLYSLYQRSKVYEFKSPLGRQISPRVMVRCFFQDLVDAVKTNHLPRQILNISPDTVADLTNIALDLSDENLVSADNVRKVIDEIKKKNDFG